MELGESAQQIEAEHNNELNKTVVDHLLQNRENLLNQKNR
jgi:hypothetical protein